MKLFEDKVKIGTVTAKWTKVSQLEVGQKIAVPQDDAVMWDEIVSIKPVGRERVFDIEVEGTHNFVGNDIFAHNTYISGNLGVGSSSPVNNFEVLGKAVIGSSYAQVAVAPTDGLLVQGNVGIGTTSPAHKIDVVGTAGLSTGTLWTNTSDARIKTNIETIPDAMSTVSQLNPVQFKYTSEYLAAHPEIQNVEHYGFIAQDFQKVFPNSVSATGPNGLLQLNASNVIPYAIKAVQELSGTQTTFNDRIAGLESGATNQESRITTALDELSSLKASVATESSQLNNLTTEITALKNVQEGLISKLADIGLAADWAGSEITFKKPVSLEGSLTLEQAASVELIGLDPKIGSNPLTNADLGITSVSDLDSAEVIGSNPITQGTGARGLDPINPAGAPKTAENFSLASLPETAAVTQEFTALDPTIEAGDVVVLSGRPGLPEGQAFEGTHGTHAGVVKSLTTGDEKILGVVTEVIGSNPITQGTGARGLDPINPNVKVVLLGKASVKVTGINGPVKTGDFLRASSTPGFAEKATEAGLPAQAGMVIGRALEDYPNETHKSYEADEPHKISVLVNVSWYDPAAASATATSNSLLASSQEPGARSQPLLEALTVTGSTSLASLTVAGNILVSANLNLTDEGVSAVTGDLSLQKLGRGKVNLFNGRAVFTPDGSLALKGTLTADKIVANTVSVGKVLVATTSAELVDRGSNPITQGTGARGLDPLENETNEASASATQPSRSLPGLRADPTIGSAILPAGDTLVEIANNQITANSKVFITPTSPTGGQPLIVSEKTPGVCPAGAAPTPGVGCTGGFTVEIEQATGANISFDYWVIN